MQQVLTSRTDGQVEGLPEPEAQAPVQSSALLSRVLDRIQEAAKQADGKASEACRKSKYSIQDYWMCMEFWAQRLHDDLAREHGLERRCPHYPFRQKLAAFKRDVAKTFNYHPSASSGIGDMGGGGNLISGNNQ